jgi:uncharacterized membrane protein
MIVVSEPVHHLLWLLWLASLWLLLVGIIFMLIGWLQEYRKEKHHDEEGTSDHADIPRASNSDERTPAA